MSENTLPQSAGTTGVKLLDVEKYFLNVAESGKQYSICLVKDCCRRFEGNHIETLKTHLIVAHSANPNSTECPDLDVDLSINNDLVTMLADDDETGTFHVKQNLSETDNFRKYFQIITEDGKTYSKCMVKYCTRRLAGKHANNMKKHLYHMHGKETYPWSSDNDDEPLENTIRTSGGEDATEKDDTAKVRQQFRMVVEGGKVYSVCLIRGCKRRMTGKRIGNLNMHLRRVHKLKFLIKPYTKPEPIEHVNIRKNFRYFVKNGQIYTKCAINDCDFRMVGNHFGNLRRHMEKHKLNGDSFATDGISDEEEISEKIAIDLETKNIRHLGQISGVEKFFEAVQKHGKLYSACLVRDCDRRFPGNHVYNMKRHLSGCHNMVLNDQRKYFETLNENGKIYSKCLEDDCSYRLSGNHRGNMKKHLLIHHNKEMEKKTTDVSIGPRKYFRCYESDGKKFSECLVKDCNRHLAGNHRQNLERHLIAAHNMKNFSDCFGNPIKDRKSAGTVDEFQVQEKSNETCSSTFRGSQQKVGAENLMDENISQLSSSEECNESSQTTFGKIETNAKSISTSMSSQSDGGMPATEPSQSFDGHSTDDDDGPQSKSEHVANVDVRKHFNSVEIDGKLYSKCLIEGCNTHLTGYRLYDLKRHLMKHKISMNVFSEPTKIRNASESDRTSRTKSRYSTAQKIIDSQKKAQTAASSNILEKREHSPSPSHCDESQMAQNYLENADVRNFFESVEINGKMYSKCLVNKCGHRTSGKHLYNLKKHLISYHKMDVRFRAQPAGVVRKVFGEVKVDGVLYSKCLVGNCEFVMSGNSLGEQKRHSLTHKLMTDGARSYFECSNVNGQNFSNCLIEGCAYRLAGNHLYNLKRHLINRHNMKQFSASTQSHSDDKILTADASQSIGKNLTEDSSASNRLCVSLLTDLQQNNTAEQFSGKGSTESLSNACTPMVSVDDDDGKRHLAKHNEDSCETLTKGRHRSESIRPSLTNDRNQSAQVFKVHSSLSDPSKACRLCFEENDDAIDIFSDSLNIANVIRLHFPSDEVTPSDLLPKFVCSACWSSLSNFHKFYVSVNEAKNNYVAKAIKNETIFNFDEDSSDFFSSEAEIFTYKDEPPEIIENDEASQPFDDPIEGTLNASFDDNDLVSDMTVDKCDFDAVFVKHS